ncbi:MAG: HAD family hydrolase, partial [Sphingobacteriaceae bacterium]
LNKIKQTEWHALESYLTCYFADEITAKPEPDALNQLIATNSLNRREVVMIGNSSIDELTAEAAGVDYFNSTTFI